MAKKKKTFRPKARLPKGMRDIGAGEIRGMNEMLVTIANVYDSYGFEPLETPAFEYTEALGKFLPDQERPNAGVFSFQDEDEQWLSLRYDLTAPLARHVAQNYDALAKPFRRYASGPVWRNEKPGPGRFRQFMQFDADTVGAGSIAADAEMCMLAADVIEALGIKRGDYVIKVNNRKLLDGVLGKIEIMSDTDADEGASANAIAGAGGPDAAMRITVLRAIDKLDRLGLEGVSKLLGEGRKDESGDFTKGAGLAPDAIQTILAYVGAGAAGRSETLAALKSLIADSEIGTTGLAELSEMDELLTAAGYGPDQVIIDPSVVRGLEYYTGPVFEAELTFEAKDDKGRPVRFGSVGGGGRYDGLVARFKGVEIPATGFSLGVSRLQAALIHLQKSKEDQPSQSTGPVVVLVMDHADLPRYQKLTKTLRDAGIRAEMYLGASGMKAQMKYADKRRAPCVIIQGSDEIERGLVQIKDLIEGTRLSKEIETSKEWREARPAQFEVTEADMAASVHEVLSRHSLPMQTRPQE